jgi:hypothetical protein
MKKARIFKPARTATQQGRAQTKEWVFEFEPATARSHDPLMGWTSSGDTSQQIRLFFDSKEAALAYAEKHGIDYTLKEPVETAMRPKSYADNFRWNRVR